MALVKAARQKGIRAGGQEGRKESKKEIRALRQFAVVRKSLPSVIGQNVLKILEIRALH